MASKFQNGVGRELLPFIVNFFHGYNVKRINEEKASRVLQRFLHVSPLKFHSDGVVHYLTASMFTLDREGEGEFGFKSAYYLFSAMKEEELEQNTLAMTFFGRMLVKGLGGKKDVPKGLKLLRKAEENGDWGPLSVLFLGEYFYESGEWDKALEKFSWIEECEIPAALFYLGCMHLKGIGAEKNVTMAIEYFVRSAEKGCGTALEKIACIVIEHDEMEHRGLFFDVTFRYLISMVGVGREQAMEIFMKMPRYFLDVAWDYAFGEGGKQIDAEMAGEILATYYFNNRGLFTRKSNLEKVRDHFLCFYLSSNHSSTQCWKWKQDDKDKTKKPGTGEDNDIANEALNRIVTRVSPKSSSPPFKDDVINALPIARDLACVGYLMIQGKGFEANPKDGLKLLQRASEMGDTFAKMQLAEYFVTKGGLDMDLHLDVDVDGKTIKVCPRKRGFELMEDGMKRGGSRLQLASFLLADVFNENKDGNGKKLLF